MSFFMFVVLPIPTSALHDSGNANVIDKFHTKKPMTIEEAFEANGYTSLDKATKEFEKSLIRKYISHKKFLLKLLINTVRLKKIQD